MHGRCDLGWPVGKKQSTRCHDFRYSNQLEKNRKYGEIPRNVAQTRLLRSHGEKIMFSHLSGNKIGVLVIFSFNFCLYQPFETPKHISLVVIFFRKLHLHNFLRPILSFLDLITSRNCIFDISGSLKLTNIHTTNQINPRNTEFYFPNPLF